MADKSEEPIELETAPNPRASIIVLHGLGADGHDLAPICDELDLGVVGAVRFVLPHAPKRPVTINGGYRMRAWYDILGEGAGGREDEAGLRESVDKRFKAGPGVLLAYREVGKRAARSRITRYVDFLKWWEPFRREARCGRGL